MGYFTTLSYCHNWPDKKILFSVLLAPKTRKRPKYLKIALKSHENWKIAPGRPFLGKNFFKHLGTPQGPYWKVFRWWAKKKQPKKVLRECFFPIESHYVNIPPWREIFLGKFFCKHHGTPQGPYWEDPRW